MEVRGNKQINSPTTRLDYSSRLITLLLNPTTPDTLVLGFAANIFLQMKSPPVGAQNSLSNGEESLEYGASDLGRPDTRDDPVAHFKVIMTLKPIITELNTTFHSQHK